jgi:hypothetical protein
LVVVPQLRATTLIGIFDHHKRLILAADSLTLRKNVRQGSYIGARTTCKIVNEPNCAVGMVGMVGKSGLFDFNMMAKQACRGSGNLSSKADVMVRLVHDAVSNHSSEFAAGKFLITICVAGVQDARFVLLIRDLRISPDGQVQLEKSHDFSDESPPDPNIGAVMMGFDERALEYIDANYDDASKTDKAVLAEQLIQMEIAEHPGLVGEPIAVLEITHSLGSTNANTSTSRWIKTGVCQTAE